MPSYFSKPTDVLLKPFNDRQAKGCRSEGTEGSKKTTDRFKPAFSLGKSRGQTSFWEPLGAGRFVVHRALPGSRCELQDGRGSLYDSFPARNGVRFRVRSATGIQRATLISLEGERLAETEFAVRAQTRIRCSKSPYGELAQHMENLLVANRRQVWELRGRRRLMFVGWGRDHVHTLKAMKFFEADVTSGLDYWLETQEPDGMFWDCLHENPTGTAPCWFGEVLEADFFRYKQDGRIIVRRIPAD